jgi:hypothetical protein
MVVPLFIIIYHAQLKCPLPLNQDSNIHNLKTFPTIKKAVLEIETPECIMAHERLAS